MEDFYRSGGIPQVLHELSSLIDTGCMTVTGATVAENLERGGFRGRVDREVIKTLAEPFDRSKGIAILRGNLAPDTGVTKPGAIHPEMRVFSGPARVFDGEEVAERAILAGVINKGDVVVIRYEGPKGGPGMREMYKAMKYLYGVGLGRDTALITDGRFSGTNNGCFVGHISPEAADGGPIAIVREGDRITIDIPAKAITLHVEEEEIARRMKLWQRPEPRFKSGYLALYSRFARSANAGATLKAW
jgi:dihydroxy-acid dehydratase